MFIMSFKILYLSKKCQEENDILIKSMSQCHYLSTTPLPHPLPISSPYSNKKKKMKKKNASNVNDALHNEIQNSVYKCFISAMNHSTKLFFCKYISSLSSWTFQNPVNNETVPLNIVGGSIFFLINTSIFIWKKLEKSHGKYIDLI